MDLSKNLGHGRDVPICFNENFLASAAGSGTDFEYPLVAIPDLRQLVTAGFAGLGYKNMVKLRDVLIVPSAAITGQNTNNFTLNVNWWRAGVKIGTVATITFASGTNGVIHSPIILKCLFNNLPVVMLPGDSITVARVSLGTGLASPLFIAVADLVGSDTNE